MGGDRPADSGNGGAGELPRGGDYTRAKRMVRWAVRLNKAELARLSRRTGVPLAVINDLAAAEKKRRAATPEGRKLAQGWKRCVRCGAVKAPGKYPKPTSRKCTKCVEQTPKPVSVRAILGGAPGQGKRS